VAKGTAACKRIGDGGKRIACCRFEKGKLFMFFAFFAVKILP
jgi:hypothetical protein